MVVEQSSRPCRLGSSFLSTRRGGTIRKRTLDHVARCSTSRPAARRLAV
ncbi:hypothetical protein ABTL79_19000 [Acinetobacter baumannii]